jgi:hypothetical protein
MSIFDKRLDDDDDVFPATDVRTCARCHAQAPTTQTEYTLIGSKHSWRCAKATKEDGTHALEWYCPRCWKKVAGKNQPPAK